MKKILFIGDAESIHLKKWVDYFIKQKGNNVFLATFAKSNITNCDNVFFLTEKNIKKGGGNFKYIFSIFAIAKIIRELKPDYINAHFSYSIGFIACLAIKLAGIKTNFSVVCHGSDILDPYYKRIARFTNHIVLRYANRIIAVSDVIYDRILSFGNYADKVLVIQYGVETERLNKKTTGKRDIDFISNRNYVPNSRIDELLQVFSNSEFSKKKIVFILPGIKDLRYNELTKKFPLITFFKSIPHDSLVDLILRSKFYISATKSDGTSLSLLEAMAGGAVPIVSNIGPNRSWILDEGNGYLYNHFNECKDICRKVMELKNGEIKAIQKTNYDLVKKRASFCNNMQKIYSFLIH